MYQELQGGSGGSGGIDYQYVGAPPKTTATLIADHNADKVTLISNTSPQFASYITVTINGTSYTGADFTQEWDSGVNYSGMGMGVYTLTTPISSGSTISVYVNGTYGSAVIVV